MGRLTACEEQGKKLMEYLGILHVCWSQFSLHIYQKVWSRKLTSTTLTVSWTACSQPRCFLRRYPGGWNAWSGWKPVNAMLLADEASRIPLIRQPIVESDHQKSFIDLVPNFNPWALNLTIAISQRQPFAICPLLNTESSYPAHPAPPLPFKQLVTLDHSIQSFDSSYHVARTA